MGQIFLFGAEKQALSVFYNLCLRGVQGAAAQAIPEMSAKRNLLCFVPRNSCSKSPFLSQLR